MEKHHQDLEKTLLHFHRTLIVLVLSSFKIFSSVIPELVGPPWKMILRVMPRASGYQLGGLVRSLNKI